MALDSPSLYLFPPRPCLAQGPEPFRHKVRIEIIQPCCPFGFRREFVFQTGAGVQLCTDVKTRVREDGYYMDVGQDRRLDIPGSVSDSFTKRAPGRETLGAFLSFTLPLPAVPLFHLMF
jgi:hypothetical protein